MRPSEAAGASVHNILVPPICVHTLREKTTKFDQTRYEENFAWWTTNANARSVCGS